MRYYRLLSAVLLALPGAHSLAQDTPAPNPPAAQQSADTKKVDALFAEWIKPNSPGCALNVIKDGKSLYSHGYGFADLEHSVATSPTTVFHIASVSKQFTAFAIYLLAKDGKLSLDDDIRKYLPELHVFPQKITIRHLLHHTSGLRDQWNLLSLAGWRLEDVITEQDILDLLWRQHDLNFTPGDEELYSNTGYTLLGVIVKRVSGRSLSQFTDERIFEPLGMRHTHFHDNYGDLVKNRAFSYEPQPGGGYRYIALSYSTVGPSSLFTTVEDLARWDENFYTGKVGGMDLIAQMQVKGKLNSGKEIDYASALVIGKYRGLDTVDHNGGDAGFRTDLLRFPKQHFSVATLCNAAQANPTMLAYKIADIYLGAKLESAPAVAHPAAKLTEVKIDPKLLDAYVGDYELAPNFILSFTREGDQLMTQATGQPKVPVFPTSATQFFLKVVDAQVTFDAAPAGGASAGVTLHQNGRDVYAKRAAPRAQPTAAQLQVYAGQFYSDELDTLYTISARGQQVYLRYPRGESQITPTVAGTFAAPFPFGTVVFTCVGTSPCDSFTLSDGRVRNLRFYRVDLKPVTADHNARQ